jgi:hypothetical protein
MRRAAALFGRIEADKKSPPPAGGKPPDGKNRRLDGKNWILPSCQALIDACRIYGYKTLMTERSPERLDRCWRKARIAARILIRDEQGRLTPRDVRLGHRLAQDPGVTPRLINQAFYGIRGRKARLVRENRAAA